VANDKLRWGRRQSAVVDRDADFSAAAMFLMFYGVSSVKGKKKAA
jgi:hypothetical protein